MHAGLSANASRTRHIEIWKKGFRFEPVENDIQEEYLETVTFLENFGVVFYSLLLYMLTKNFYSSLTAVSSPIFYVLIIRLDYYLLPLPLTS